MSALDAHGDPQDWKISVAFAIFNEDVFHSGSVFWLDDADALGREIIPFGGKVGVWPNSSGLVICAERLGFEPL